MTIETPIAIGAAYAKLTDGGSATNVRVTDIHIDESGLTNVQFREGGDDATPATVDKDTFIEMLDSDLRRVNTDHDAWQWQRDVQYSA